MSVVLSGVSGQQYQFQPFLMAGKWNDVGGCYAFAHQTPVTYFSPLGWAILYIGKADSFRDRMNGHERWREAAQNGATHVLAHVNTLGDWLRSAEERDLIAAYNPPLNTQLCSGSALVTLAAALAGGK